MRPDRERLLLAAASVGVLIVHALCFWRFFPSPAGEYGHDYALNMPKLLAGYFWYLESGLAVPWFTPAFCGGVPLLADPQSLYYSLPQLLTLRFDPFTSTWLTFLAAAAVGFAGAFLLLRRGFGTSAPAAWLGAVLFLFNGFFNYRMAIGHVNYHSFMLLPLVAWLCLREPPGGGSDRRTFAALADAAGAGLLLAYVFLSGGIYILPAGVAGVVAVALVHGLLRGRDAWFWGRLGLASLLAAAITSFKWVGSFAYLRAFPRDYYLLPGADGLGESLWAAFRALFFPPASLDAVPRFVNEQWLVGPLAFEHGVTSVPLLVFAAAALVLAPQLPRVARPTTGGVARGLALACLLCVPVAINTYAPGWNEILKRIPLFRESSMLVQWYALYIPLAITATALAFDRLPLGRASLEAALACALLVVAANAVWPHTQYMEEEYGYQPARIAEGYQRARAAGGAPPIEKISVRMERRVAKWSPQGNDDLVDGGSQLLCREPMFGYRLERFPRGSLHPAPVDALARGVFNLKNPACYVFPEENDCAAGDHFREQERAALERFRSYRPYPFAVPARQQLANVTSAVALAITLATLPLGLKRGRS